MVWNSEKNDFLPQLKRCNTVHINSILPPLSCLHFYLPPHVKPAFINKVWQVNLSTGVAPGMLYAFLSDGTLVITSPNSKATFGAWTYKNGKLTMIEASQEYPTDILNLSHDELRLRSHNPGGSIEIVLVPARVAPLPP